MRAPHFLILAVVAVVLVAGYLFGLQATTWYQCPYCGASGYRTRYTIIPLPMRVSEGALARYWRAQVDRTHQHTWVARCTNENFGSGSHRDHPGNFLKRWLLKDRMLVSVLRSLPTAADRKAFMEHLWRADPSALVHDIWECYLRNPGRTDWIMILRKHGIRP